LSTILKALKKLEHELPDESDTHPGARKSATRQTLGRRAKRFMRIHKSFWIFTGLITLAVAAWLIYFPLFPDSRKSVSTSVPDKPDKIIKKTASARQIEKQKQIPAQVKELLPDMPIPASRSQKKSSKKKVSRKAATSVKSTRSFKSTQPSLRPKILGSKPISVKPLEDSKLKLQAISWSENPDNRIAVINGSIMREGESIEGFRIVQIGQDDVVVRAGQNERKLVFGFK
jgi:hypothetical protein